VGQGETQKRHLLYEACTMTEEAGRFYNLSKGHLMPWGTSEHLDAIDETTSGLSNSLTPFGPKVRDQARILPGLWRLYKDQEGGLSTNPASGISCHAGPISTGMHPDRTTSVRGLLDAVSPRGIR